MSGFGTRSLVLLVVAAALTTATPAGAQVYRRTSRDGTTYFTNIHPNPPHQRATPTSAATPEPQPRASVDYGSYYSREIAEASARHGVPERLIWAVIQVESGFDPRAVSSRGARGLMQLMPETAAILGVRDAFNPRENIHGGARHLRGLMERFRHDLPLALAAYNAGEKPVASFRGIPPYPETREYVTRVLRLYGAPLAWELQATGIQQIVERDGTVVYTNVAPRRVTAAVLQAR